MAKTRTRRGARRNLTRRGGGKESGGMDVEGSKVRSVVKPKSMKHGAKGKTHTVIRIKGVTKANITLNKKQRAEKKAEKYLQKYRAALAAAAAAAAEEEEEEEEEEDEDEEAYLGNEEEFEERMAEIPKPFLPYVAPPVDNNNAMKKLLANLPNGTGPAGNNNNSQ
jgi:NACalpha-BTF3-like transcription factor